MFYKKKQQSEKVQIFTVQTLEFDDAPHAW